MDVDAKALGDFRTGRSGLGNERAASITNAAGTWQRKDQQQDERANDTRRDAENTALLETNYRRETIHEITRNYTNEISC